MSRMSELFDQYKQQDENSLLELIKYRHAYDIFMEYFEKLPDEDKKNLHQRLEGLGL
tara:strand:- start:62 stop:232 length:171 start_codon:yes stop_codon:yes gene_type:complete